MGLELADLDGHGIEMALDDGLSPLCLLALIGEQNCLQQWVLDRRGIPQRDIIEQQGEPGQDNHQPEHSQGPVTPIQGECACARGGAGNDDDVQRTLPEPLQARRQPSE